MSEVLDISEALDDFLQAITLSKITQTKVDYEDSITTVDYTFQGVVQPLKTRDLMLKPEYLRAFTWLMIHTKTNLELDVKDKITYAGKQYTVMNKNPYGDYGYFEYHLVEGYRE